MEAPSETPVERAAVEALTVTEAARMAEVSVQALRQRIQRGTLETVQVTRNGREVAGVSLETLERLYPGVSKKAAARDAGSDEQVLARLEQERERAVALRAELETRVADLGAERDEARERARALRKKLEREREQRARLEGAVAEQERQLAEQSEAIAGLKSQVVQLQDRLALADQSVDREPVTAVRQNGPVWPKAAAVAILLATCFFAGRTLWGRFDQRMARQDIALRTELQALQEGIVGLRAAVRAQTTASLLGGDLRHASVEDGAVLDEPLAATLD